MNKRKKNNMRRWQILLSILMCLSLKSIAQHNPVDTTYYESGAIKCIKYMGDVIYTGYKTNVHYEDSFNPGVIGEPIADTSFYVGSVIFKTNQYLSNGIQFKRYFSHEWETINGQVPYHLRYYIFWAPLDELYSVKFNIAKDSTAIEAFWISAKDSTNSFRSKEIFTKLEMKDGFGDKSYHRHIFSIPNGEVTFHMQQNSGYLLKDFYVGQVKDSIWVNKKIVFYPGSLKIKLVGEYTDGDKSGIWTEYYENGNIKSNGSYSILYNENKDELKNGIWKYYDIDKKMIKQEHWSNGKLLKTKTFK